ncbi:S8 family serine peptidase [Roseofilum sp. BLCC_M154]|uniref:S8 family serine peptidase n=1 Tax=Roseofilum acuticapitatum BLCC-M154 TaxID=3022444 RepID=A0ABT7ASA0_9CYAN|nr:DUF4114 domain-containing protein [Roseofilum acuticapitatum]MDJ1169786.1 S8 family serine peptidase [Roseofilum acuticapitatum BLCC-M154]
MCIYRGLTPCHSSTGLEKKSPKTSNPQDSQTFILEPILTPSGIVDGLEETPDVPDVDSFDVPELDTDLIEETDTPETQEVEPDANTGEEIDTAEVTNLIPDEDIEEIEFITDLPTEQDTEPNEVIDTESEVDGSPEQVVAQAATPDATDEEEISFITADETEADETLETSEEPEEMIEELRRGERPFAPTGTFTVGETGEVEIEYLFDGGKYQGEVAFFSLEGMEDLEPGSEAFIQEAAARALGIEPTETPSDVGAGSTTDSSIDPDLGEPAPTDTDFPAENTSKLGHIVISDKTEGAKFEGVLGESNWNQGEFAGVKTVQMRPGDTFGIMLVPNKSVQQVFDNPSIGGSGRPLFSLSTANPDDGFHIGQIADVTGDGNTFVMEDIRVDGKSDYDYNDIIFRIKGATGKAVHLDDVIDIENDWRETELGQEILDYIKPEPIEVISEIESVVLDPEEPESVIELSEIFAAPEDETVTYELVEGGDVTEPLPDDVPVIPGIEDTEPTETEASASLEGDRLQINPQPETDITEISEIAVRAVSETGESAIHTLEVVNNTVSEESVEALNTGLEKVQEALNENPDNLIEVLENPELLPVVEEVFTQLEDNFGTIYNVLERPDILEKVGIAPEAAETFNAIIDNPEIGELFGLPGSLQEAFTNEDFTQWDNYLINAQDAASLILPDTPDVPVAFIDFAGDHGEDVTEVFESVNPHNEYETLGIEGNNWAQQLIAYVDSLRDDAGLPTTTDIANTNNPVGAGSATIPNTNPNLPEPALSPTINGDNITGENVTRVGADNANHPVGAGSPTIPNTNPNLPEPALSPTINAGHDIGESTTGNVRGIVNLSFDLTQIDDQGQITTRYQLTPEEQLALQYARDNNVLLVVASGNTGDAMSALGQAADEFDNIITVGAVNSTEEVADYSSRGETLTLVAPGGEHKHDPDAFVGTSRATSYVTGAASLVWQANPDLSYQQVKEILVQTAKDLGEEGWDTESGAGLLNVTEAVLMAGLIAPEEVVKSEDIEITSFTGEGRVITQTRAAGEATEQAIQSLTATQNQLLQQWQTLSDLGNPDLSLEDLQKALEEQKEQALERYQQTDTDAAISLAESEQLAEALALATRHHQLELGRLQTLQTRQQELNEQLAALKAEREQAVEGNAEQIELLEEAIAQSKEAVKEALAKLQYQLVDPDTLLADPNAVQAEIDKLKAKIAQYQQKSAALRATASSFYQQGAQHRQTQKHHTHLAHNSWATTRGFCGRILRKRDTAQYNHHMAIANQAGKNAYSADSQGHVLSTNAAKVEQLTAQMNHQTDVLSGYQQLLENNNQLLAQVTGESQDAHQILKALQEQAAQKTQLAEKYWQQAALAEQRRKQNQDTANHHNNLSRRWEVVGRGGRCGVQPIHGWRHYPEHIAPRDQAQHQANVSENERRVFEQWARQAQMEADNLNQQARALAERVADWPELKQGIQYEINANEQKLQAEEDLLALQTPVQRQQLETLDLQIQQAEEELAKLEGEQLPSQEDKANATETRLTDLQEQSTANREERKTTQKDLQTFLETYGYLLPYPERLQAIKKQIQQLEDEKIRAQELLIQLSNAITTNPDLVQQFEAVQAYISDIDEQLDWAKLQEDQINWSAPQSPQRLALAKLIEELKNRRDDLPETNSLPLQEYIDFLREMENRSTSFLNGFDDLQERLDAAQEQQTDANETLERLQGEYRELGLEKAAIEEEKLIGKQVELANLPEDKARFTAIQAINAEADLEDAIALKEQQIADTNTAIRTTQEEIKILEHHLAQSEQDKVVQEDLISDKEAQIADLETEKQGLEAQKTAQENQLANQQQALDILKTELSEIEDKIAELEDDIAANESNIKDLQAQRETHEEERDYFQATLDEINERIADKEVEIADKYREIELTDNYLRQMNTEVERLQNRVTVLNEADALESDYQNAADAWQEALDNQVTATEELVEIRKQGEQDRQALLELQSDLAETQTNLAEVTAQQEELQAEVADAQKDLAFTQHQLRTQELQLHSLRAQDAPLRSAEGYYYGQAQYHRQHMWYWNGHTYAYHGGHAAAYRHNLQKASRLAEQRNNNWPKIQETEAKIAELKGEIPPKTAVVNEKQAALAEVTPKVTQLTAEVAGIEGDMAPIVARLKPLQEAEKAKLAAFQNAVNEATDAADELAETTSEQAEALQRMISFGVLGTESDVDFFATEVEPKVNEFIEQLESRTSELTAELDNLNGVIADWEDELNQTTDEVSREALTELIAETTEQRDRLLTRQNDNNDIIAALTTRLEEATNAIQPLRQQQELEIRQQLDTNDERLAALERQLETEEATETALSEDTILAYAQLGDRLRQDLGDAAKVWTEQLLEGHAQTKEIGASQQELSQSVDDLVAYIEENLGKIDGERDRTLANLRDAITTLEVAAPRFDELEQGQTTLTQEIDKLKQWIEQDAKLWEEIAPIAERYGAESEELEAYQQQYEIYKQQDEARAQQYEAQRHQHQMNANHWNGQIRTWGIARYESVRALTVYNRGGHWRNMVINQFNQLRSIYGGQALGWLMYGSMNVPVYGWVHNHHAEAQRNAAQHAANVAAQQRDASLQLPTAKAHRAKFLNNTPENGTAIDILQAEAEINSQKYNNQLAQVSAELAQTNAQASAALAQADWYEKRAADHWQRSRKNGPTWTERRKTWKRGKSGKKKEHWVTLTHIDHDWILWDTYTKYAQQLREQAVRQLVTTDNQSQQQERLKPLAEQWASTVNAVNAAEPSITASRNLVEQLEASREQIPAAKEALQQLEDILPEVEQQLAQAQKEADEYNAKVLAEWKELEANDSQYLPMVEDILKKRGALNRKSQELQHQLADVEQWVERQTVALTTETEEVNRLREDLIAQREILSEQIAQSSGNVDLQTKQAQLQNALGLLDNKATVLQQQQRAFSQKRTLLTAEHEVILAEQRLLDAYLTSPGDLEQLQKQLTDARAALAEAQRLAEQAEASSGALTAPLQEMQADLLAQNDEHLRAAREHQQILRDLLEATELNANYTLQAAQKQREVNDLEFQIQQRLQEMIINGNKEAEHLLNVAMHNDMATAAEIYYRDYNDIASDTGGSCAGGIARPEDRALANRYYHEMMVNRQLQQRAQAQANHFGHLKRTAEAQKNVLQAQQNTAAKMLKDINDRIAETQEEREQKQQELAVAQARLDGITRIREQTEQTFITLINLEQLNLAQAQLEQTIATQRQEDIEKAVEERLEREAIELERQRLEARAKLEQLEQLQAEDALLQGVNAVRSEVGLDGVDGDFDPVQVQSQMAALLTQLKDLEQQQPDLPDDLKVLLAEAEGDIHQALQGEEAANIQGNLFKVMAGLIGQVQHYKADINRIELEEQWDIALLQTAEQDVQKASKDFLKELERMEQLDGEKQTLDPLYLETLNKVALAEQAVDISNELAQQSKEMLEQIIEQRVAERKARKKYFWNSTLGLISQVMTVLSTIVSILSVSFPVLIPFAIGLSLATAGITAIQAVMNGDWLGGIFSVVMAGLNAVTMGMSNTLTAGAKLALQSLQSLAAGAFSGARSIMSGESILGFLQILGSIASVASAGVGGLVKNLSATTQKVMLSVVQSLEKAPQMIYGGIKAIQNGDWLNAISNIFNAVLSVGQSFAGNFNSTLSKVLEVTGKAGNTGLALAGVIKDGGIEGLLSGLNSILNIWKDDLVGLVDKISGKDECCVPCEPCIEDNSQNEEIDGNDISETIAVDTSQLQAQMDGHGDILYYKHPQTGNRYNIDASGNIIGGCFTIGNTGKTAKWTTDHPIDPSKPTKIIVHGYRDTGNDRWVKDMADAYRQKNPGDNVVIIDWGEVSNNWLNRILPLHYGGAAKATKDVGLGVSQILSEMGINLDKTTVIGHSLGAQVAGYVAQNLKETWDGSLKVIALDPAGPMFEREHILWGSRPSAEGRLDPNDGDITVIRTTNFLGVGNTNNVLGQGNPEVGDRNVYLSDSAMSQYRKFSDYFINILGGAGNHQVAYRFWIDQINNKTDNLYNTLPNGSYDLSP